MPILIQKNGAFVSFIEGGVIRATLSESCTMNLSNKRQGIDFIDVDGKQYFLPYQAVTQTQLAPAAAVPFSGSVVDLWDLLNLSFFDELHASVVGAVSSDDVTNLSGVAGANVTEALDILNDKFIFPKIRFSGVWEISGEISPPAIVANQNDYSPTGFQDNTIVNISAIGSRQITGFAAPNAGESPIKIIRSVFGGGNITLINQSVSSSPQNRIQTNGQNETLNDGESAIIWYNQNINNWNILSTYQ